MNYQQKTLLMSFISDAMKDGREVPMPLIELLRDLAIERIDLATEKIREKEAAERASEALDALREGKWVPGLGRVEGRVFEHPHTVRSLEDRRQVRRRRHPTEVVTTVTSFVGRGSIMVQARYEDQHVLYRGEDRRDRSSPMSGRRVKERRKKL